MGVLNTPVLQMSNISKSFGGLRALIDVELTLYPQEILAIVGDNGAGKSTLIKVLTGVYRADSGSIKVHGEALDISNRRDSIDAGIAAVYQNLGLVDTLAAPANVFLGSEPIRKVLGIPFIDNRRMRRETIEILRDRVGIELPDINETTRNFSGGQRQAVAIARAVNGSEVKVLIMDEPTAALGPEETRNTLNLIRSVRERGIPIILISHNLDHVFQVADRVMVMRGGRHVDTLEIEKTTQTDVLGMIIGSDRTIGSSVVSGSSAGAAG
ncbi:MAG: ATP-binding cassette domain-containing protein [Granulosicoccus sp.]|nr:ATP-binding cassette domain-containing protein [Granulosicoccus sp.]